MNSRKIADFLLLRPAFNSRNVTSLLLVAVFFGVYVAAGGTIEAPPPVKKGASFGTVQTQTLKDSEVSGDVATLDVNKEVMSKDSGSKIPKADVRATTTLFGDDNTTGVRGRSTNTQRNPSAQNEDESAQTSSQTSKELQAILDRINAVRPDDKGRRTPRGVR